MDMNLVLDLLDQSDSSRSLQVDVGPSELLVCRRRVWHRLQRTEPTNKPKNLPSFLGSAFHEKIEKKLRDRGGQDFLIEFEAEYEGLRGHIDLYDPSAKEIVDWKTTTLKNLGFFPSESNWVQVNVYGLMLNEMGLPVETVSIVVIPRDGADSDIRIYSMDWDRTVAQKGIDWLEAVKAMTKPPAGEKSGKFCSDYCQFYDRDGITGCPSGEF